MRVFYSRQFARFLLTGGVAALANLGARWLLDPWVGFSSAVLLAYLVGMVTAYVLARRYVFGRGSLSLPHSVIAFVGVNLLAVAQTWAVSLAMLHWALPALGVQAHAPEIAHLAGVLVPVFTSYLGHKHGSFRP